MQLTEHQVKTFQKNIALMGDQLAYKSLFLAFQPWLYQFAYSFIKSHELAEEIVSDVFIRLWEKRSQIEKVENLRLYLYVATKHTAINYHRKIVKNKTFQLDHLSVEIKSLYADPEQVMITKEMAAKVRLAVDQLPPRCKMIFKLVKEDGLKYKEVAELLDISYKTVEAPITLAVKKLGSTIRFEPHRSTPFTPSEKII